MSPLTICCNAGLDDAALEILKSATQQHNLRLDCDDCREADIAFGQPDPQQVMASSTLRWIHITSAGYTRYDSEEMRAALQSKNAIFTNSSHVYDEPCAQHVLAMMLAFARQLPPCYADQLGERDWQSGPHRSRSFLLNGQTTLLLGFGAIAQRLVQLLAPFEMRIIAVRRRVQAATGVEVIDESQLESALSEADHVVNILPEAPSTIGFVDAARLGQMKRGAFFYNIGRGRTVDQAALLKSLGDGHVGGAYLDVTEPEPLPPDHELWSAPNCFITPHSGGGHRGESGRLVQHFLDNLRRFENAEALIDQVLNADN